MYVDDGYWLDGYIDETTPPAVEYTRSGGWLPIIWVDDDGNPINPEDIVDRIEDTEAKPALRKAAERVADDQADGKFTERTVRDVSAIVAALQKTDTRLANSLQRGISRATRSLYDDDTALILLLAT